MRKIDIGILRATCIKFDFIGDFMLDGSLVCGENSVSVVDGALCFCGKRYDTLCFMPQSPQNSFVLHDVVIGVGFHWERKEKQTFKGELHFIVEDGEVRAINRLFVEDYLVSVISSEMSATSSLEFLKAHTIISRSWLYAQLEREECVTCAQLGYETDDETVRWYAREDHKNFDFCADDHCQRYQGLTRASTAIVRKAIDATWGELLMDGNKICDARFSKCCGGVFEEFQNCWEPVKYSYLVKVRDGKNTQDIPDRTIEENAHEWIMTSPEAFCNTTDQKILSQVLNNYDQETTDFYRWREVYDRDFLSDLIKRRSGYDLGKLISLEPLERGKSGRIMKLKITGSEQTLIVGKELEIRRILSESHLKSSAFDVIYEGDDIILEGKGWGHGAGLCQIGAAVMASKGYTYREILEHYYPNTDLGNL